LHKKCSLSYVANTAYCEKIVTPFLLNATLKTDYDETIGLINIVPQDIGRVVLNLINNAFHAVVEKKKRPRLLGGSEEYDPTVSVTTTKKINRLKF
jgi:nitrogen-specific signal transduction histidine kinase